LDVKKRCSEEQIIGFLREVALSTDGQRLWAVQIPPGRTDHLCELRTSVPTAEAMTSRCPLNK
jgi:hypothetical protein